LAFRFLERPGAAIAVAVLAAVLLGAIFADLLAPYPFTQQAPERAYGPPSTAHPLGTDQLGRDMLSRLLHGARVSLAVALVSQLFILTIGVPVGALAGYFGGRVDQFLMRSVDVLLSFPDVLLVIIVTTSVRAWLRTPTDPLLAGLGALDATLGGLAGVITSLALIAWLVVARLVRGEILSLREREFVQAARVGGAGHPRILFRHLVPNTTSVVVVAATYWIPRAIMIEAALSFIGLGVQPPLTSWGGMIFEGYRALRATPHMLVFPALALSATVLACNFLGDAARDVLDPRLRHSTGGRLQRRR
jgi:ABC-type dipeptide/oligopeptide/nickel transport system permease subunit